MPSDKGRLRAQDPHGKFVDDRLRHRDEPPLLLNDRLRFTHDRLRLMG